MKQGTKRYTVEYKSAGQPRAYAGMVYDFTIFVEWIPYGRDDWEPMAKLHDDIVTRFARAVQPWPLEPEWHQPKLERMEPLGGGKWRFVVKQAYLD